jgi:hypothetical protein
MRSEAGFRVLALHLQGSVELDQALPAVPPHGTASAPLGISTSAPLGISYPPPLGIMVGSEYAGVSEAAAQASDVRVRIAMAPAMEVRRRNLHLASYSCCRLTPTGWPLTLCLPRLPTRPPAPQ